MIDDEMCDDRDDHTYWTHSTAFLARVSHATFWINGDEEFRKIKIVSLLTFTVQMVSYFLE